MKKTSSKSADREDIVDLLLEDHLALKELIKTMKNPQKSIDARVEAFNEFSPLFLAHAKPEEESLYKFLRYEDEFREESFEGEVEHGLADQISEETERTDDDDQLAARIKVLAELVERHIHEEEYKLFPELRKKISKDMLVQLGERYVAFQAEIIAEGEDDSPRERDLEDQSFFQ